MITYRFALRIVLPAIMSALGLAGPLLGADARIQLGDKIVTAHAATPVKSGETTLSTLGQGVELTAEATRGDWVKVTVDGNGKKTTGWIHARHLTRAGSSADRMAANAHLRRAIDLLNRGDLDGAMERLNHAIRLDPTHAEAYQERGRIWLRKNEPDRGIADCTEAIRLLPDVAAAYVTRGAAWSQKGEYDKTIADCDEAIRLDSTFAIAYAIRAEATHDRGFRVAAGPSGELPLTSEEFEQGVQGVLDKTIADYTHAIRLDPTVAVFYKWRADTWQEKEDFDNAVADYAKSLSLDPKNAEVYVARSRAWSCKSAFDKAIADCTQAVRLDPQLFDAYILRRLSRYAKGDQAGATEDLAQARKCCSAAFEAGYGISLRAGHRRLNDVNGVLFDIAAAGSWVVDVSRKPVTNVEALKLRITQGDLWQLDFPTVNINIQLERREGGDDVLWSLLVNGTPYGEVRSGSCVLIDEAYDVTVDGEARRPPDPTDARGFSARADAARQKGEYDKAIADSTEAIRLDPEYADAYANRGEAWRQKGELEKALGDFAEAL
ncbi:MAG: tetratricopeptide repeat protein, partial [Planctomycetes bacterium]|nr:tetratricopeptide repeat protein [Planctomycetota bacterium]